MTRSQAVLGYLVAVFPLVATPGASFTLLVQRVGTAGRRQALPVVLGTVCGLYVHASLAVLGLSALVMRSSTAFATVRLAGAAYLVGLGGWSWFRAGHPGTRRAPRAGRRSGYLQALLGNVLNPKAASIFLTLLPQFLDPHRALLPQVLLLATAQAVLVSAWLLAWTAVLARAAGFAAGRAKAVLTRVGAAVLIALGLRTALS
ncbi:LysE family translocator [Kitasatospora viridis]|uniref:Threonine/homoserine/homoserine lactone efflux protein n=1 Tax=Kitasatospora viridis TaxID=281105 RepID=A0A561UIK2_9ACTN|nr:LysE family translocator [Kitasatospora viridis]TWF99211.1 threonine/homoserine/homoserine lactone efflux protein [Kitasatospora viridis]